MADKMSSNYYYVCSTYWYPDADEFDENVISMSTDAVYDTLEGAIECIESTMLAEDPKAQIHMHWDAMNSRMIYRTPGIHKYLITRIDMCGVSTAGLPAMLIKQSGDK